VRFSRELTTLLPDDLPGRDEFAAKAARHLELIVEANQYFNLTRIIDPREAAIKHILDSVMPWRLFSSAKHIVDAGTGPCFPGIPLALVLPSIEFTLAESIGKKARFVESVVKELDLANVKVAAQRAEEIVRTGTADLITARAVARINKVLELFAPALKQGKRLLLYKGPDVDAEISEAQAGMLRQKLRVRVVERYILPDALGARTVVEISR
jgi:16S rRNA (guanine527-N7)-methyltransferase